MLGRQIRLAAILLLAGAGQLARAQDDDAIVVNSPTIQLPQLARGADVISWVQTGTGGALWRSNGPVWRKERVAAWTSSEMMYQMSPQGDRFLLLSVDKTGLPALTLVSAAETGTTSKLIPLTDRPAGFGQQAGVDGFEVVAQEADGSLKELVLDFKDGHVRRTRGLGRANGMGFDIKGTVQLVQLPSGQWAGPGSTSAPGVPADAVRGRPLLVTADGMTAYFNGKDELGYSTVLSAQVPSGKIGIAAHADNADVTAQTFSPKSGELDAYMFDGGTPTWVGLNEAMRSSLKALSSRLSGQTKIVARSDNDESWLIENQDVARAPTYYLFKPTSQALQKVVAQSDDEQRRDGSSIVTSVTSEDGARIQVWALPPDPDKCNRTRRRCPFVLKIHGGPHRRDGAQYDPEATWLRKQGYWVLRVNFRGSTGFGDRFANASDGEWGRGAIADIHAAVKWLVKQPGVAEDRGVAMGTSYGGFAAIALATFYPGTVRCAESLNGGGDLRAFATLIPERRPDMADDIRKEVGDINRATDLARILEQSPAEHIMEKAGAFLVEYGVLDKVSIPEESSNFIARMVDRRHPHVGVRYVKEGHALSSVEGLRFHYELLRRWISRCTSTKPDGQVPLTNSSDIEVSGDAKLLDSLEIHR